MTLKKYVHPTEHGRLISIVKKIILIEKLKLELKLTPKDALGSTQQIKKEIKNVQRALKNTIKLGSPMVGSYEKWLVSGLHPENFDIKVRWWTTEPTKGGK
tara:strand:- start:112 stop:414 length:303 start_codon:yes stop_codon:yes gene_type:complete